MRQIRKISKSKRVADILALIFIGLASGFLFKYLDDTMTFPNMASLSDLVIYTFALDRVFSEMGVFIVIGVALAVFASTPFRASINNLIYFICLNIGYYGYMYHYWGFVGWSYIAFWVGFALITPFLGYFIWYVKDNTFSSKLMIIGIFATMTFFTMSAIDYTANTKIIVYIGLFTILYSILKPVWYMPAIGIFLGVFFTFLPKVI